MRETLLRTKLSIPQRGPVLVPRPQLFERLDQGLQLDRNLTLVSAPAGFGKTTCIIEWVATLELPVAWLSLDPADDDPGRFFTYLVAALQQVDERLGREIEGVLRAGQLPPSNVISATLINDILEISGRFLLVLDDFQVIQDEFILGVLQTLVTNLPQPLHLVLLTREEPPLPLARLRANNQMTEIRAAELRFTGDETAEFLNAVLGLSLAPTDIAILADKTEGWIVGLQLVGLSIRDRVNPSIFIADLSGSHRHILSYLTEEVLSQQPAEIQDFLLQTSILDRLTGDLCDTVTGRTDSRLLLERLFNDNLFLIPLDDEGHWYRYHQLFADLLRGRLHGLDNGKSAELHRRASHWYAQTGQPSEAVQHAILATDYEAAVILIEKHAMDLLMQWHAKTVKGWMQLLPPEWAAKSPKTNLAFAWMHLMRADFIEAMPYIEHLREMLSGLQLIESDQAVQAEWLALQATLLSAQGKLAESLMVANEALAIVPETDAYVRGLIYSGLANSYRQMNDYSRSVEAFQLLIRHGRVAGSFVLEMLGISGLALYAMERGELHYAFELAAQAIERVERSGMLPPISAALYGELGGIYYYWYEIAKAHPYFSRASQVSTLSGYSDAEIFHHIVRSRLAQIDGDLETAVAQIQAAVRHARIDPPAAVQIEVVAQQVQVALAKDQLAEAEAVLIPYGFGFQNGLSLPEIKPDQVIDHPTGLLYLSVLWVILYQGQSPGQSAILSQGLALANRLIAEGRKSHVIPLVIATLLIRAQMQAVMGDESASRADVISALELAEPEGFITIFLEAGERIADLLADLLRDGRLESVQPEYVRKILSAFPKHAQPAAEPAIEIDDRAEPLIDPLSKRELEILRLIGEGCTNQDIVERLVITLHTVKKHSSNIYTKLGVSNRTQAVARARQLKLL